jgi:hypothetical protein
MVGASAATAEIVTGTPQHASHVEPALVWAATSPHLQPGVRLAASIHFCSSGCSTASTLVTLTYRVRRYL